MSKLQTAAAKMYILSEFTCLTQENISYGLTERLGKERLIVASTCAKEVSPAGRLRSRELILAGMNTCTTNCPALIMLVMMFLVQFNASLFVLYSFFLIYQALRPYVQGYSSHATYKILSSSNLQLDNDLVGSGLLILSVEQVDVPSRLVYYSE